MLTIEPTGAVLGATARGIDLAQPLSERDLGQILLALGGYLFAHQLRSQFRYNNMWAENDLLIWDHLGTLHCAIADYGPDEIRLIRRCEVMATKVFDPDHLRPARELAAAQAV